MEIPKELSHCVKVALFRLSSGDLTTEEMQSYLSDPRRKNTGFPPEVACRTVELLTAEGFLDDKRYFLSYVKRLDEKLLGPRKIREELRRHKFPPSYIEAALGRKISYGKRARRLLEKKSGAERLKETPEGRKKLVDFLVRQGYDFSTAGSAVKQFSETEDEF